MLKLSNKELKAIVGGNVNFSALYHTLVGVDSSLDGDFYYFRRDGINLKMPVKLFDAIENNKLEIVDYLKNKYPSNEPEPTRADVLYDIVKFEAEKNGLKFSHEFYEI